MDALIPHGEDNLPASIEASFNDEIFGESDLGLLSADLTLAGLDDAGDKGSEIFVFALGHLGELLRSRGGDIAEGSQG